MITESKGNLLKAPVEALVNTVNTQGVMGKGIALQFKKAFPEMYKEYAAMAKNGEIRLGRMHVWSTQALVGPKYIINFPTKGHWREKSRILGIDAGLRDLARVVRQFGITSIAVPPLGCGNGGLNWSDVAPRIHDTFKDLPEVDVRVFPPAGAPAATDMLLNSPKPKVTPGRAALVGAVDRYTRQAFTEPSLIETQKLMYFLQVIGEPLNLKFAPSYYGPYADNLRKVLSEIEGHYLIGFGDGSAKALDGAPLAVKSEVVEEVEDLLDKHPDTKMRLNRVLNLAEGYETAYGMELLATVHWVAASAPKGTTDEAIASKVAEWSPRKARMFMPGHTRDALKKLRSHNIPMTNLINFD